MNMILMWILIGTTVGFAATMIEFPFTVNSVGKSVFLGIIGASLGGVLGELMSHTGNSGIFVSPMLYIVMGSFLSTMIPGKSNLL